MIDLGHIVFHLRSIQRLKEPMIYSYASVKGTMKQWLQMQQKYTGTKTLNNSKIWMVDEINSAAPSIFFQINAFFHLIAL